MSDSDSKNSEAGLTEEYGVEKNEKRSFGEFVTEALDDPEKWRVVAKMRDDLDMLMREFEKIFALVSLDSLPEETSEGYNSIIDMAKVLEAMTSYAKTYPDRRLMDFSIVKVKRKPLDFMGVNARQVTPDKALQDKMVELLEGRGLAEPLYAFWVGSEPTPHIFQRFRFMPGMFSGGLSILFDLTDAMRDAYGMMGYPFAYAAEIDLDISRDSLVSLTYENKETGREQMTFFYNKFRTMYLIFKPTEKGTWDDTDRSLHGDDLLELLARSTRFRQLVDEQELFLIFDVGKRRHLQDPQDVLNSVAQCFVLMQILGKKSCCFAMTSGFHWVFGLVSGDEKGRKSFRTSNSIPIKKAGLAEAELIWYLLAAWFFIPNRDLEEALESLPNIPDDSDVEPPDESESEDEIDGSFWQKIKEELNT